MSTLLLLQCLQLGVLRLGLEINRDFIVEHFCINKKAPEKLCSGQCFIDDLTENSVESEEEQPQNTSAEERSVSFNWLLQPNHVVLPKLASTPKQLSLPVITLNYCYAPIFDTFHPPKG